MLGVCLVSPVCVCMGSLIVHLVARIVTGEAERQVRAESTTLMSYATLFLCHWKTRKKTVYINSD